MDTRIWLEWRPSLRHVLCDEEYLNVFIPKLQELSDKSGAVWSRLHEDCSDGAVHLDRRRFRINCAKALPVRVPAKAVRNGFGVHANFGGRGRIVDNLEKA